MTDKKYISKISLPIEVIDKFNEVGEVYPISPEELKVAMERVKEAEQCNIQE